MNSLDKIIGTVVGHNEVRCGGRTISCWEISMQAAVEPKPLDLSSHMDKLVEVSGRLHGDLWEARFIREVPAKEERYKEITGKVVGSNVIEGPKGPVSCYRNGMAEAWVVPLILSDYIDLEITVGGDLRGDTLYRAQIVGVPEIETGKDPDKEAKSLNDLLHIRAANREKIEAINGNLGTALGFKWTNSQKTDHPCVIIFVPQKLPSWLVPEDEKAPEILEAPDGTWCLTDVVTGGKAESLEDITPLPELSAENEIIVHDLRSGGIGLIGGIQLAFYGDGVEDTQHSFVGTAGIAVQHKETNRKGFLTNQHVADAPGRYIYHPWHKYYAIGSTDSTKEVAADEDWYSGVIDETHSYIRCDCGFIAIDAHLEQYVRPGLHIIGNTGSLLRMDPDGMDVIGQKVISIGRTRGVQRGTIVAYAYEFHDDYFSIYTDLLIIGEDGRAFSWKGDSGKIIVTDDAEHRPIALLWGGWQERLRQGRQQEVWSYAIDLGKVLDVLKLDLLRND